MADTLEDFRALMRRVRAGSREATSELVARYEDRLRRALGRRLDQTQHLRLEFDSADFTQMAWLNSDIAAGEAKRLYNQAEKLRAEKKFIEAGQLFAQVRAAYPTNEWGHAAGFRIGQCFVGLQRPAQAIDWWQKFVKESPAGPWRGQAQVALVDATLQQLDLKKATEHAVAAGTVLAKGLDKEAGPSWTEAAYDIYFRQGIVSLVDGRFDAAVQGFQEAKQNLPSPILGRGAGGEGGLDRLIAAAQQRAKVVPDELTVGNDRAATALALGNIYNVLHQYGLAKGYFSLLLSGPLRSNSAAHRSFAGLGLACAVLGSGKAISVSKSGPQPPPQLQAKAICQASLSEYPKGSWHDETLYRLATLIQDVAESSFGNPPKPPSDGKNADQAAKPPAQQERDAKAEKERHAALLKARAEALPYWQDLVKRFPDSPRCEPALYNAGVLLYEAAEAAPAGKSDQLLKDADALFDRLLEAYPKSPYAGDAFVHRMDFALERKFDMKLAVALADRGITWAKQQKVEVLTAADGSLTKQSVADAAKAIRNASAKLPEWAEPGGKPPAELLNDLYNLYLRAGVVAYLQEKYEEAIPFLDAGGPARPIEGMRANFDSQKAGVFILMECARRKTPSSWPDAVNAAKSDSQKLAIKLADIYLHAQRAEKAEPIYDQILAGGVPLGRPNKAVEGYCLFQLALLYSEQGRDRDKSVAYYKKFLTKDYADLPFAADALLRLTVLEYNTNHDARRAIPQCQYIVAKYPAHREAERAMYFLAQMAVDAGDKEVASSACKQFLAKYPQSGWRSHVEQILKEEVPKLKDKSKGADQ